MAGKRRFKRGIYLLPTLFTLGNLFCGFLALIMATGGHLAQAALLIIVAGVLDGLDGRVARLSGTTSDFGLQFDSLADIVSFGVAPAFLAYHWALSPLDRLGWTIAFLFIVCAAMRLARYNLQTPKSDKRFFAGLPSPAAAGALATVVYALPNLGQGARGWIHAPIAVWVTAVGLLMISRFRYRSFKELDLRNRRPFVYVLPVAAGLVSIVTVPKLTLLILSTAYLLSAPVIYVAKRTVVKSSSIGGEVEHEIRQR